MSKRQENVKVGDRVWVKSYEGDEDPSYEGEAVVHRLDTGRTAPAHTVRLPDDSYTLVYMDGTLGDEIRKLDAPAPAVSESARRKGIPLCTGVLDYFPAALAAVAQLSKAGNDKHNPGEPLHHARGKSMDHADCLLRHLADRGETDPETGLSHSVAVAWRALALLQEELEAAGAPKARGAK